MSVTPPTDPGHDDEVPAPALVHLGRFAPPIAQRVREILAYRRIAFDHAEHDDAQVVRVDRDFRDDVAVELWTNWAELLHGLDRDIAYDLLAEGGTHPGWHDAPGDAWVDEQGRLQVEVDEESADARAIGPMLTVVGLALTLLGLVADTVPTGPGVTFGLFLLILGLVLPL